MWFKESGFDPLADSGYAKGYAQFTDDTIKELKRLKFIDDDFDIWDPEQSKSASKKYINFKNTKFNKQKMIVRLCIEVNFAPWAQISHSTE